MCWWINSRLLHISAAILPHPEIEGYCFHFLEDHFQVSLMPLRFRTEEKLQFRNRRKKNIMFRQQPYQLCRGFLFALQLVDDNVCIYQDTFHWLIMLLPLLTALISSSVHTWSLSIKPCRFCPFSLFDIAILTVVPSSNGKFFSTKYPLFRIVVWNKWVSISISFHI